MNTSLLEFKSSLIVVKLSLVWFEYSIVVQHERQLWDTDRAWNENCSSNLCRSAMSLLDEERVRPQAVALCVFGNSRSATYRLQLPTCLLIWHVHKLNTTCVWALQVSHIYLYLYKPVRNTTLPRFAACVLAVLPSSLCDGLQVSVVFCFCFFPENHNSGRCYYIQKNWIELQHFWVWSL